MAVVAAGVSAQNVNVSKARFKQGDELNCTIPLHGCKYLKVWF